MSDKEARLRKEQDILERIENVKRLIQMETTLETANGVQGYSRYCEVDSKGQKIGGVCGYLLHKLQDEIQLQLLSILALCYGDNPDIGDPNPMLEWNVPNAEDAFIKMMKENLTWNV